MKNDTTAKKMFHSPHVTISTTLSKSTSPILYGNCVQKSLSSIKLMSYFSLNVFQ